MHSSPPAQQWDTDAVLTVPNVLSLIRLLGIPLFCWLMLTHHDVAAVVMLAVFAVTDWFDGFLARLLKQRSPLGAKLDPIADRLYILATVVVLLVRGIVPWWFVVVLAGRDLMLAFLVPALKRHGLVALPVNLMGKAGTMLLLSALPMILLGAPGSLAWPAVHTAGWCIGVVGAVVYWIAGVLYLRETLRITSQTRGAV